MRTRSTTETRIKNDKHLIDVHVETNADNVEIYDVEHEIKAEERSEFDEEEDPPYLTGNPFFEVVITQKHIQRSSLMYVPKKLYDRLPRLLIPMIIRSTDGFWEMNYVGNGDHPRFGHGWKDFLSENDLRVGDGCVFELVRFNEKKIEFRMILLRNEEPDELRAVATSRGSLVDHPIDLD